MKMKSSLFDWCNYLFWIFALLIIVQTDKLSLHLYFNSFHSQIGDFIMPHFTNVGDGLFLLLVAFFVFLFRSRKLAIILFIAFLIFLKGEKSTCFFPGGLKGIKFFRGPPRAVYSKERGQRQESARL